MFTATSSFSSIWEYLTNPEALLLAMGPWVLVAVSLIVFIESGVLFPVLPGDSLIFTAGLLHIQLGIGLPTLIVSITVCALLGNIVGYILGKKYGRRFFKDDARFLKTEYLGQAEQFFIKYGGRSLVLARFVPFVRTFIPIAAGIANYNIKNFTKWNLVGALLWGAGLTYLGSLLGNISFVRQNIEILAIIIVFVSIIPMIVEIVINKRKSKKNSDIINQDIQN
ncbi:DedA family protein [Actinomyces sp. zg-332]|uniref:DedA family protein n=1 Tax=Actinomyces sp. zg-332 TaxID=2708340 RepID=UPI001E657FE9|nr:VTT domain-containing protein [Actinomyces sp. zg-332]